MKIAIFFIAVLSFIATGCDNKNIEQQKNKTSTSSQREPLDSMIIHDNNIHAAKLDKNKDGKLYQCPMHYEVISDEADNCPLCKMTLEEYTVQQVEENLNNSEK